MRTLHSAAAPLLCLAALAWMACDGPRAAAPIELAQSDDPGVTLPQPGTGLYDAGYPMPAPAPAPGIGPRPTDPSVGPGETPTVPRNPGTDPGPAYPTPPGASPGTPPGASPGPAPGTP